MTAASAPRKVLSIQYLRAVAALAVVFYHGALAIDRSDDWPFNVLTAGVDVFFVISGFIMWMTTCTRPISTVEFWKRRAQRIVPLYWIVTTLAVAVAVVAPSVGGATSTWHVVSSYLFLPSENPDTGRLEPIVSPGWTLNYEMLFYLVFGLALLISVRRARMAVVVSALVAVAALGMALPSSVVVDFYGSPIILEFVLGMAVAALVMNGSELGRIPALSLASVGVLGVLALGSTDLDRLIMFGVPCAAIVAAATLSERRQEWKERRTFLLIGDASYSIYLFHGLAITATEKVFDKAGMPDLAMMTLAPAIATAAGVAVYVVVEQPINRHFQRQRARARPSPPQAVA